jgi:hypothetical protein
MRRVRNVARIGEVINACKVLVGKPEGKGPLGTLRNKEEDKSRAHLNESGGRNVWSGFIWLRIETIGGLL